MIWAFFPLDFAFQDFFCGVCCCFFVCFILDGLCSPVVWISRSLPQDSGVSQLLSPLVWSIIIGHLYCSMDGASLAAGNQQAALLQHRLSILIPTITSTKHKWRYGHLKPFSSPPRRMQTGQVFSEEYLVWPCLGHAPTHSRGSLSTRCAPLHAWPFFLLQTFQPYSYCLTDSMLSFK